MYHIIGIYLHWSCKFNRQFNTYLCHIPGFEQKHGDTELFNSRNSLPPYCYLYSDQTIQSFGRMDDALEMYQSAVGEVSEGGPIRRGASCSILTQPI